MWLSVTLWRLSRYLLRSVTSENNVKFVQSWQRGRRREGGKSETIIRLQSVLIPSPFTVNDRNTYKERIRGYHTCMTVAFDVTYVRGELGHQHSRFCCMFLALDKSACHVHAFKAVKSWDLTYVCPATFPTSFCLLIVAAVFLEEYADSFESSMSRQWLTITRWLIKNMQEKVFFLLPKRVHQPNWW